MTPTDDDEPSRLPRSVVPVRYELTFEPDLDAATFRGSEAVTLTVHEPVSEIVLNAQALRIRADGPLEGADGVFVDIVSIAVDETAQRATIDFAGVIQPGTWTLRLGFSGDLSSKLTGFYRSTYEAEDGTTQSIAVTHFEPTDARRAFPCWDEPDLKAVFAVELIVSDGLTAISNAPETGRHPFGDGRVRVRFADTMVMSTYLLGVVVGRLEVSDVVDAGGVPTRVVHVPGKGHLTQFALEAGSFSLRWFADYYGIPYPDAKVDHIGLPDFAQGAMEQLGCITYRETLLLVDPDEATQEEVTEVAETVAHELAHMWFGDLVTMRWWNGIWLNEAFATFMSMLAVDAYRPDWRIWAMFSRLRAAALDIDSLGSTRAIEYPVHSPDDAMGMFDTLTYMKGAGILWMLEAYLGADRFRDGIRRYLRRHMHGNAETQDLWDALESETGEPVRRIMDAWIFQPGFPAIRVSERDGALHLEQRRYQQTGEDDGTRWPVPLLVRQTGAGGTRTDTVLVEGDGKTIPLVGGEAAVVANATGSSFVRVWYEERLRSRLVARAEEFLSPEERHALVDDAWAAVVSGADDAGSFVDLAGALATGGESDLRVWQAMLIGLGWFDRFLEGPERDRFRAHVRGLVAPKAAALGFDVARDDESDLDRALRGVLLQALAVAGNDPDAQSRAREIERAVERGEVVDAHLAASATEVVARFGDTDDYEGFRKRASHGGTPQEQRRYLLALALFPDVELMDRTLADCFTDEIRAQDAPFLLARATAHRDLGWHAWRYLAEHWSEAEERFASSNMIALTTGVRYLSTDEQEAHVAAFFATHGIPQGALTLTQNLERQRIAVGLRRRSTPQLRALFS